MTPLLEPEQLEALIDDVEDVKDVNRDWEDWAARIVATYRRESDPLWAEFEDLIRRSRSAMLAFGRASY